MRKDSYLFSPTDTDELAFIDSVLMTSGLFANVTFFTGLWPTTYNFSYSEGSGRIATVASLIFSTIPTGYIGYQAGNSIENGESSGPFICQTDTGINCYVFYKTLFARICLRLGETNSKGCN